MSASCQHILHLRVSLVAEAMRRRQQPVMHVNTARWAGPFMSLRATRRQANLEGLADGRMYGNLNASE